MTKDTKRYKFLSTFFTFHTRITQSFQYHFGIFLCIITQINTDILIINICKKRLIPLMSNLHSPPEILEPRTSAGIAY